MKPRCVFQIDGIDGGILNIAERPNENRVLLIISNGDSETQIGLSKENFGELASLQYSLRFIEPQAETSTLRVVV